MLWAWVLCLSLMALPPRSGPTLASPWPCSGPTLFTVWPYSRSTHAQLWPMQILAIHLICHLITNSGHQHTDIVLAIIIPPSCVHTSHPQCRQHSLSADSTLSVQTALPRCRQHQLCADSTCPVCLAGCEFQECNKGPSPQQTSQSRKWPASQAGDGSVIWGRDPQKSAAHLQWTWYCLALATLSGLVRRL